MKFKDQQLNLIDAAIAAADAAPLVPLVKETIPRDDYCCCDRETGLPRLEKFKWSLRRGEVRYAR
jgi:hypothetical protein